MTEEVLLEKSCDSILSTDLKVKTMFYIFLSVCNSVWTGRLNTDVHPCIAYRSIFYPHFNFYSPMFQSNYHDLMISNKGMIIILKLNQG